MSADDLGPDGWDDCGDRRNRWLGRRQCGLGRGFLTRIGKFKPVGLGQWCLSQAGADGRRVHGCYCCHGNRCLDSLADQQGGEHGHTPNRKPYGPNHYSNPATHQSTGSSGAIRAVRGQDEFCLWTRPYSARFNRTAKSRADIDRRLRVNTKVPSVENCRRRAGRTIRTARYPVYCVCGTPIRRRL